MKVDEGEIAAREENLVLFLLCFLFFIFFGGANLCHL